MYLDEPGYSDLVSEVTTHHEMQCLHLAWLTYTFLAYLQLVYWNNCSSSCFDPKKALKQNQNVWFQKKFSS